MDQPATLRIRALRDGSTQDWARRERADRAAVATGEGQRLARPYGGFWGWPRAVTVFVLAPLVLWLFVYATESLYRPDSAAVIDQLEIVLPEGDRDMPVTSIGYGTNHFRAGGNRAEIVGNISNVLDRYDEPALLIPRARRRVEVSLNGQTLSPLTTTSRLDNYSLFRPQFYVLPKDAGESAGSQDLRIFVESWETQPYVEFPFVGEIEDVRSAMRWRQFFGVTLINAGVAVCFVCALVALALAVWRADRWTWGSFAGLMLCWAATNLVYAGGLSAADPLIKRVVFSVSNYLLIVFSLSFVNEITHRNRFLRRIVVPILGGIMVFKVLPLLVVQSPLYTYVTISLDLIAGVAVLVMLWQLFTHLASRRTVAVLPAFLFTIAILAVVVDITMAISPDISRTIWPGVGITVHVGSTMAMLAGLSVIGNFARTFVRAQHLLENTNSVLTDELEAREAEIRAVYTERAAQQREAVLLEERKRIMRDMHDGIGGNLLSLSLRVRSGELSDAALADELSDNMQQLRLIVDSLDTADGELDIALGALRGRIEPPLREAGIKLEWDIDDLGEDTTYGPREVLSVYRMIQEAVSNAIRHSGATHLAVRAIRETECIVLEIVDNGNGFDPNATPGRGLASLRDRAVGLGGSLEVVAGAVLKGTAIRIRLPVRPEHDRNN